jgi:hypothetical protein
MNILAIFFGAMLGLLGWSRLAHLSYAIHDAKNEMSLVSKLSDPKSGALAKLLRYLVAASFIWLIFFGSVCLYFAYAESSKHLSAWFFGGVASTPIFIAFTTRKLRRLNKRLASSSQA